MTTPSAGSETPHTPGPWHVAGEPELRCVVDNESAYIVDRFKLGGRSDSEHAANARLISAAPDLLAACDEALVFAKRAVEAGIDGFSPEETTHIVENHVTVLQLKAAIRKARGTT